MAAVKESKPKPDKLFYAVIPDYRENDVGEVKKPFRGSIVFKNTAASVVDGIHKKAECLSLDPDENGIYTIDTRQDDYQAKKKAMDYRTTAKWAEADIRGPFESRSEALSLVENVRPKTDKERLEILEAENKKLKAQLPTK